MENVIAADLGATVAAPKARIAAAKHSAARRARRPKGRVDAMYEAFARAIRDDLKPAGELQGLMVDRVVGASWRFRQADRIESLLASAVAPEDAMYGRDQVLVEARRELDHAMNAVDRALEMFARVRDLVRVRTPAADSDADGETPPGPAAEPLASWRDRLVLDGNVSETSPVVRGTWVTVGQVVTLVVDGWTWSDILRAHPELAEADIRACLDYSVEEENGPRF